MLVVLCELVGMIESIVCWPSFLWECHRVDIEDLIMSIS